MTEGTLKLHCSCNKDNYLQLEPAAPPQQIHIRVKNGLNTALLYLWPDDLVKLRDFIETRDAEQRRGGSPYGTILVAQRNTGGDMNFFITNTENWCVSVGVCDSLNIIDMKIVLSRDDTEALYNHLVPKREYRQLASAPRPTAAFGL